MPFGSAPNVDNLPPSGPTNSMETRDQAPKSCSFTDLCWLTARPGNQTSPNTVIADMPMMLRRSVAFLPKGVRRAVQADVCRAGLNAVARRPSNEQRQETKIARLF